MRENRIEKSLTEAVKRRGGICPKWVSPGTRGVPDRIVIMPEGRTIYVETKAPGKSLSPMQAKMFKLLRARGHQVYKLDSLGDVARFAAEVLDSEV